MIDRPNWDFETPPASSVPMVVEQPAAAPVFSQADLALIDSSSTVDDDGALATARAAVASGAYTVEEAAKHRNLSEAEAAALAKPRPKPSTPATALKKLDAEIVALTKLRSTDPKKYDSDAVQNQLRELYKQREIAGLDLPDEVVAEWRRAGGVEFRLGVARKTAQAALDSLDEQEQEELTHTFENDLPASAQSVIYRFISLPPSSNWRPARDDELARFAGTEEGRELVAAWGNQAARNIGIIRGRIKMMVDAAKSQDDKTTALAWLDDLPANQFKAVLSALLP